MKNVNLCLLNIFKNETEDYIGKLDKKIRKAYDSINAADYPQTYAVLGALVNGNLKHYTDGHDFLGDLVDCDEMKALDENVAELVLFMAKRYIQMDDVYAMSVLASLYYRGRFGEVDYVNARKYYKMVADHDNANGFQNQGYIYYYGLGIRKDYKKAFHYFMKAYVRDDGEAAFKLGDMYRFGYYVEQDPATAKTMYFKSYKMLNELKSCCCMGDISKRIADVFFEGMATGVNKELAFRYYHKAEVEYYNQIRSGDPWAAQYLHYCIERQEQIRKGLMSELSLA